MKIGLVLDDTLDTSDGVQQYVLLVGDWLSQQGHNVHYLVGHTVRKDIANVHSLARNIRVRFNKNRLSVPLPASGKAIQSLLKKEQFDILHVQMPFSPFLAGKVIRYAPTDTAIVGTFHVAPHGKNVIAGTKALGVVQQKSLQRIDKVISVSEVAQQFALTTQNIQSVVIPNAINLKLWEPAAQPKQKYDITFVGRLVTRKGCIYLLRALKRLSELRDISGLKVVIVGDGPERSTLEEYAQDNGLSEICHFEGYVSEDEKRSILQSSKLAVFPATGGESFGIVLLEAMAAGATVLAGNNPGYTTVLGSLPSSLFVPKDDEKLANNLQDMLAEARLLKKTYIAQQELVKQYDIEIVGNAILKIYKQVRKSK